MIFGHDLQDYAEDIQGKQQYKMRTFDFSYLHLGSHGSFEGREALSW
jgi:hypothetical protein